MLRLFFAAFFVFLANFGYSQQYSVALGAYTGFTVPYTIDTGMDSDPRYKSKYTIKAAPFGLLFSMDYENIGFQISPGIYTIGQNYYVVNTAGGQDGTRELDLKYASIPAAFKIHLIDLSFFRLSALATGSAAFLYSAEDRISHAYTKLKFPIQTYPNLPPEYSQEYDGVIVNKIDNYPVSLKPDYKPLQIFAGLGLCSDWNVTEHWRISFDLRFNYGLMSSRSTNYEQRIKTFNSIYDIPGKRKEMFTQFALGISRFLDFDKGDKDRAKNLKGTSRLYKPQAKPKTARPNRRR
jgi:hypothetical protein